MKNEGHDSNMTQGFEIVVVAMPREVERRQHIEKMLSELQVPNYRFLDATDGKQPGALAAVTGYDAVRAVQELGRELTPSEIACFDSHRRVWEQVAQGEHPVLVLESDARIDSDTLDVSRRLCSEQAPDWGLVMLYYHECLPSFWGQHRLNAKYKLVKFANHRVFVISTFLLTPVAAKRLLQHGQQFWLPVDNYMTGRYINKGFATYGVFPPAARLSELSAKSSIQAEREGLRVTKSVSALQRNSLFLRQFWRRLRKPKDWL